MSVQPQFETPHDTIRRLWAEGKNTHDIAVYLSQVLGERFHEAQVCRSLYQTSEQAKGGAQ